MHTAKQVATALVTPPVAIRFTPEEKTALANRAAKEHRAIASMAKLLILDALAKSGDLARQPHATSVAAG